MVVAAHLPYTLAKESGVKREAQTHALCHALPVLEGPLCLLGLQGAKPILYLLTHLLLLKGKMVFSGKDGWDGEALMASDAGCFPEGFSGNPQPSSAH